MKKLAALVFAVVLGCASLALVAGCSGGGGGGNDYAGHYSIVEVEAGGQTVSMSDLESYGYKADDIMSLDLNADGTAKFNIGDLIASFMGDNSSALGAINAAKITWEPTNGGVNLTVSDTTITLKDEGSGKLSMDAGGTKMTFAKA